VEVLGHDHHLVDMHCHQNMLVLPFFNLIFVACEGHPRCLVDVHLAFVMDITLCSTIIMYFPMCSCNILCVIVKVVSLVY